MKTLIHGLILILLICSCENELKKTPIEDGKFQTEEKLNDSILKTKTYNSNQRLITIDLENLKTNIRKRYYYNEHGQFTNSVVGFLNKDKTNVDYLDCRYFNQKGKIKYRRVVNFNGDLLAHYYYDTEHNLKRYVFYNENTNSIRSEISFNKNGKVNEEYSSYLLIKKDGDKLILNPSWFRGIHKNAIITIYSFEGTKRNLEKEIKLKNTSELSVNLKGLDPSKTYSIAVSAQRGYIEGFPYLVPSSIYIDDFKNIPNNNLHPIIVKDGKIRSGKYLLNGGKK